MNVIESNGHRLEVEPFQFFKTGDKPT